MITKSKNNTKDPKTSTQCNKNPPQEFHVVERTYSKEENGLSIALANIKNIVSNNEKELKTGASISCNKTRILRAIDQLKKKRVNIILFPEFCLTGYFWDDPKLENEKPPYKPEGFGECWEYMNKGALDHHKEWLRDVKLKLDGTLKYIIFNGIRRNPAHSNEPAGPKNRFLNSTFVINKDFDCDNLEVNEKCRIYNKTFLPGIENVYTKSGQHDYLLLDDTPWGRFGFTTCYDMAFSQLFQEYAMIHEVKAIIEIASWRATGKTGKKEYQSMNVRTNHYYGFIWDLMCSARAATNQIWIIACNVVGHQKKGKYEFWGGSGLWAPSGMKLFQASNVNEELVVIHNVLIKEEKNNEMEDFSYCQDFKKIYKSIEGKRTFTRVQAE